MGDRYNPLYELGSGAFGKAWVVKDNKTGKKCVSKVIQIKGLSGAALDRCVTEVAVLSACSHFNIVRYIEAFVNDGALHIMMEYASGGDLQQKIEKQNGVLFASDIILDWFLQVVMALEYIHSKNILHRDLKPQNIFLTESGVVKLGDFGIARVLNSCDDLASTSIGTPFYISPEICQRKPYNSSSDMWAVGCLLYQISTLRVPFQANTFDELTKKIIKAKYDPVPRQLSPAIQVIISKLLVTEPRNRLSALQILNLDSFRGMVLYLKCKYHIKTHVSRTRSNSMVSERPGTQISQKSRSSSTSRMQSISSKRSRDRLAPDSGVESSNNSREESESTCSYSSSPARNIDTSDKQLFKACRRGKQVQDMAKRHANNRENSRTDIERKDREQDRQDYSGVEDENIRLNGASLKANTETKSSNKNRPDCRTFLIKDSVARRLSEASPKLSMTVRKQRFSLSISEQGTVNGMNTSQENQELVSDDVFQSPKPHATGQVNSQTYLVKVKDGRDANNNSDKFSNCYLNGKHSHTGLDYVNETMIQALSVSNVKQELAKNILLKELGAQVGNERCEQLINQVRQVIVEEGQSYQSLRNVLPDSETELIPLICMYLTL